MTTIHSIAAATDFSPGSNAAVERAVQLALAHGATLRLLHAFDVSAGQSLKGLFNPERFTTEVPPDVQMRQHLNQLAASLAVQTGLHVDAGFAIGKPVSAINAYVAEHQVALLVLGSRADPALPGLGHTASKVLRLLACPALVVRSGGTRPYEKVLMGVDLQDTSARVAVAALNCLSAAQYHLLHAVDPELDRVLGQHADAKDPMGAPHESMRAVAVRQLDKLAQELSTRFGHPVAAQVVDDVPSRAIVVRARTLHADCVAVGFRGQGAYVEHLTGSLVERVLRETVRDVLVVP